MSDVILTAIKTYLTKNATTVFNINRYSNPIIPVSILNIIKHKKGCNDLRYVLNKNICQPTSKTKREQLYQKVQETFARVPS